VTTRSQAADRCGQFKDGRFSVFMPQPQGERMESLLNDRVGRWVASAGIDPRRVPTHAGLLSRFEGRPDPCRPGADPLEIDDWEKRHGFRLPKALRAWLVVSNGFYGRGPLIHPLSGIGPMVPFARVPGLVIQPESWFELGNPNVETVCIDLAYDWPGKGGGNPIFTSGDDRVQSPPRVIATSFEEWFLGVLQTGGRESWFDRDVLDLGDPWSAHRANTPAPLLPDRLRPFADQGLRLLKRGADERSIAERLGITLGDVETLFRHLQHVRNLSTP
jgi:hypothetical protein